MASIAAIALSFIIALVNGVGEEMLWRGLYLEQFQSDRIRGYWYPAVAFAAFHLVPTYFVGDWRIIVPSALFIGLVYGHVAGKTRSILWTSAFHVLTDFTGLIGVFYLS